MSTLSYLLEALTWATGYGALGYLLGRYGQENRRA